MISSQLHLTCPKCGRAGTAVMSLPALTPALTSIMNPGRHAAELVSLSEGFRMVDRGAPGDPHFECARCRVTTAENQASGSIATL